MADDSSTRFVRAAAPRSASNGDAKPLADGRTVALKRGHLHISPSFQLARDRRGRAHPGGDDGLGERLPLPKARQLARELSTLFGLRDQAGEGRVTSRPVVDDLGEEVLGHMLELSLYRQRHSEPAAIDEQRQGSRRDQPRTESGALTSANK